LADPPENDQAHQWTLAPTSSEIDALARVAFDRLPPEFLRLCKGLVIQVHEFADDETLDEMGIESPFDLFGLFRGRGLAQSGAMPETGAEPNLVFLYRRPLLDLWCEGEETLEAIVEHVLIHEIGHHFGLSDEDIERIEASTE
jgi:predicted Zn-dependent protease with MMP-like domain